jgi:hypothetical protein
MIKTQKLFCMLLGPTFSSLRDNFKSGCWNRDRGLSRAWTSAEFLSTSTLRRDSSYCWSKRIRDSGPKDGVIVL